MNPDLRSDHRRQAQVDTRVEESVVTKQLGAVGGYVGLGCFILSVVPRVHQILSNRLKAVSFDAGDKKARPNLI
jgi:hypothetical protein